MFAVFGPAMTATVKPKGECSGVYTPLLNSRLNAAFALTAVHLVSHIYKQMVHAPHALNHRLCN